jgi:hypothetical protein
MPKAMTSSTLNVTTAPVTLAASISTSQSMPIVNAIGIRMQRASGGDSLKVFVLILIVSIGLLTRLSGRCSFVWEEHVPNPSDDPANQKEGKEREHRP